jgi:hypothetical protein
VVTTIIVAVQRLIDREIGATLTVNYAPPEPPSDTPNGGMRPFVIVLVVLVALFVGVGSFLGVRSCVASRSSETQQQQQTESAQTSVTAPTGTSSETVTYVERESVPYTHVTDDPVAEIARLRAAYTPEATACEAELSQGVFELGDSRVEFRDGMANGHQYALRDVSVYGGTTTPTYVFTLVDDAGNAWSSNVVVGTNASGGSSVTLSCAAFGNDVMTRHEV